MGNFVYLTNLQQTSEADRRHGEFSLMVEANSDRTAIGMFRDRINQIRESTGMFEGTARVFFIQLLEIDTIPMAQPMLLNYKSIAGDPTMPFIRCTVPGEDQQICRIFDWKNNQPEIDGQNEQLFLQFDATA
jgi:hypothetical protein